MAQDEYLGSCQGLFLCTLHCPFHLGALIDFQIPLTLTHSSIPPPQLPPDGLKVRPLYQRVRVLHGTKTLLLNNLYLL